MGTKTAGSKITRRQTDAFTVLSVRLWGDFDLDGGGDADDRALLPSLTNAWGWAMPAAANVFRPVRLRTDVGVPGKLWLRLAGDAGAFRVFADASGTNMPLLACGQTVTNGVNGVSFLSGSDSDLYVEAVSNGTATLTYRYAGTGDAAGIACSASLKMTAFTITLEPVTTENSPEVYNPCGIATNGTGYYKIAVDPASLFPDDKISWSVVSGAVSFVENGDTGRLVAVKGGGVEGGFKLGVDIEGLSLPTNPCVAGRVLEPKVIPVTVWIVRKDNGSDPARTQTEVNDMIAGANAFYKQCAMAFQLNGTINYTNRSEWLEIVFTNGVFQGADDLKNITNETGGIEVYFVDKIIGDVGNEILGFEDSSGMIISAHFMATPQVFAHEIGHTCGLRDIYSESNELAVTGPVMGERLPFDWGGGYYRNGLAQFDLLSRLLMNGWVTFDPQDDIPVGNVYGVWYETVEGEEEEPSFDIWYTGLAPVGLGDMTTRQPNHQ